LELSIAIGDDIGNPQVSLEARLGMVLVNVYRKRLPEARSIVQAGRMYDVPLSNHRASALLGLVSLHEGDPAAKDAFRAAIDQAGRLIDVTPDRFDALDCKGFALCGLALCEDRLHLPAARAAYAAARAVISDAGVVSLVLQWFDALAPVDPQGILAEVRPVAAGQSATWDLRGSA
jgi:hypothetical protein